MIILPMLGRLNNPRPPLVSLSFLITLPLLLLLLIPLQRPSSLTSSKLPHHLRRMLVPEARLDRVDNANARIDFSYTAKIESPSKNRFFGRALSVIYNADDDDNNRKKKKSEKKVSFAVGADGSYGVVQVDGDLDAKIVVNDTRRYDVSNLGLNIVGVRLEDGVVMKDSGGEQVVAGKDKKLFLMSDDYRAIVLMGNDRNSKTVKVMNASETPISMEGDYQKVVRKSKFGVTMSGFFDKEKKLNFFCIGAPDANVVVVITMDMKGKLKPVQKITSTNSGQLPDNMPLGFGKHCTVTKKFLVVSMSNDIEVYSWNEKYGRYGSMIRLKNKLDAKALNVTAFEGGATSVDEDRLLSVSPLGTYSFEQKETPKGPRWMFSKLLEEPLRPKALVVKGKTAVVSGDHDTVVLTWKPDIGAWKPKCRLVDSSRRTRFVYGRSVALSGSFAFVGEPAYNRVLMWDLREMPAPSPGPSMPPTPHVLPIPEAVLDPRICFDAGSKVRIWSPHDDASRIANIRDVMPGDFIESWRTGGKSVWSRVFLTQHSRGHRARGTIIDVEWTSSQENGMLRVAPGHYLKGRTKLILPEELQVGDELMVREGLRATVTTLGKRRNVDVVNVHTMNDAVVVDGVLATCFPKVLVAGGIDLYKWLWWSAWALKVLYFIAGPSAVSKVDDVIHGLSPFLTSPLLGMFIVTIILMRWYSTSPRYRKRLKIS